MFYAFSITWSLLLFFHQTVVFFVVDSRRLECKQMIGALEKFIQPFRFCFSRFCIKILSALRRIDVQTFF